MRKEPKLPVQTIDIQYSSEHSDKGIKRTIFVYEGEDVNLYLSKAWKKNAVRASINNVTASVVTELKPDRIEGEWVKV